MSARGAEQSGSMIEVRRLRAELEEVLEALGTLPDHLAGVDRRVGDLGRALHAVEQHAATLDDVVRDLGVLVRRLAARVEWLERHLRLSEAVDVVELDDVDEEVRRCAAVAEAGHVARSQLLSASARSALVQSVQEHADAVQELADRRAKGVDACRRLIAAAGGAADPVAAAALREAATGVQQGLARRQATADAAAEASRRLADDVRRREVDADVLDGGERAWHDLLAALRERVAQAVGEGALLPDWFTTALGPMPPAGDGAAWMEAATAVLAYRVTYGIHDPFVALGEPPDSAATARRHAWYQQLRRQVRQGQA